MRDRWTILVCPECGEQVPRFDLPDGWRETPNGTRLHRHDEFNPTAYIAPEPVEVERVSTKETYTREQLLSGEAVRAAAEGAYRSLGEDWLLLELESRTTLEVNMDAALQAALRAIDAIDEGKGGDDA